MRGRGLLVSVTVVAALAAMGALGWAEAKQYEMEVLGIQGDPATGAPQVILRGKEDKRELAMFIGAMEAQGILLPLQNLRPPRPMTHDLLAELIHRLNATVKKVVITDLRDNTYFATLYLVLQGQEMTVDSRPSDAIALALRENAPILAEERVFARPPGQAPGPAPRRP